MSKHCIIVNPIAGRGAGKKAIPEIESYLNALGIDYDLLVTNEPGHGIKLAEEAGSNGYQTVVAVGGDGTANEVINGLMHAKNSGKLSSRLAVLPVGRGNDFSFGMGVPQDLEAACKLLGDGHTRMIDVGFVKGGDYPEGRYFGNGVGIGFDAVVGFEAEKLPRFITGMPAYLIAALKTIFLYFNAPDLRVDIDGQVIEQACLIVSLMNGKRMGGAFMFAPESEPDDGLLNLCIAGQVSRIGVLGLFPKVMSGTQRDHEAILMPVGKTIRIEAITGSLPVHADGETICVAGKNLEVTILKQQLEMVCE
ncbi:MAG: diacylglycerol kinase family lipid kinase [Brevefilum sp.]|nr:diacylglycerol kinase family lipid kinase [Brevefilum sp.]MDW7754685.1 diacylglycerol kinase family lipid kinase [Brevefilum sp.]